ncbi:hypothetical protein BME99_11090 [Pseudomonas protegens]|nr:hypothetical protein BME99_11090 [Pseudomonas protegens]
MAKQLRQPLMGGQQGLAHRQLAQIDPQRQGVDEHSQGPFGALAALHPPQQHGAEHHLLLPRQAAQHPAPGQVHQACGTDPQLPRLQAQAPAQQAVQGLARFAEFGAASRYFLQAQRQGRLVDIAEHLAEERLMLGLADAQARLGHVVAVRHRFPQALLLARRKACSSCCSTSRATWSITR